VASHYCLNALPSGRGQLRAAASAAYPSACAERSARYTPPASTRRGEAGDESPASSFAITAGLRDQVRNRWNIVLVAIGA